MFWGVFHVESVQSQAKETQELTLENSTEARTLRK